MDSNNLIFSMHMAPGLCCLVDCVCSVLSFFFCNVSTESVLHPMIVPRAILGQVSSLCGQSFGFLPDQGSYQMFTSCQDVVYWFVTVASLTETPFFKCLDVQPVLADLVGII